MQTDADRFQPEQVIDGYRIMRRLGKGGMAEVYEVESVKTGAAYALKVFSCRQANAIFLKKRFLAEGRLLVKLRHPRIVGVHDFGFTGADETPYYVMDLVLDETGVPCSLRDAIARGLSSEDRIALWYGDLVEALKYIHAKGVVHRDVSLENVLVGADGRAVLSDFGVSKVIDRDLRAELDLSLVTMVSEGKPLMGKAFYIAPEVRAGREETPASDLYSLGVLFFYLLTQTWYVPGARVADLLALFDEQWQSLLPVLLADDPAARRAENWSPTVGPEEGLLAAQPPSTPVASAEGRFFWALLVVALIVSALVGVGGGWFVRRHWPPPSGGTPQETVDWDKAAALYCPVFRVRTKEFSPDEAVECAWIVRGMVAEGLKQGKTPGHIADQLGKLLPEYNETHAHAALTAAILQTRFMLYWRAGDEEGARLAYKALPYKNIQSRLRAVIPLRQRHSFLVEKQEEP